MLKAQLITIGTEITTGEVINSNAAWVSQHLEECGVRVYSHVSVTDQREEILAALKGSAAFPIVVVTGGLGPTSDDLTRECLAEYCTFPLEFDDQVYSDLVKLYEQRGLTLREAHRQQCCFPKGSERLKNPVGTALGFAVQIQSRTYFVLPGPPRELEGIWNLEVAPRLKKLVPPTNSEWVRWTTIGLPESEVAELVEAAIAGTGLEVGYRAAVPYVKVKVFADRTDAKHRKTLNEIEAALLPYVVGRGSEDVAEELLKVWSRPELTIWDFVTDNHIGARVYSAQRTLQQASEKYPHINIHSVQSTEALPAGAPDIEIRRHGEEFIVTMNAGGKVVNERMLLPYKVSLSSERGKRSAAEWVLWLCFKTFKAL